MQFAGFHHFVELALDAHDVIVDGSAVGFELCLAGATDKAKAAALVEKLTTLAALDACRKSSLNQCTKAKIMKLPAPGRCFLCVRMQGENRQRYWRR